MNRTRLFLSLLLFASSSIADEVCSIALSSEIAGDEAVKVAISDLKEAGAAAGIEFQPAPDATVPDGAVLIVGAPDRNPMSAAYAHVLSVPDDGEGYQIVTITRDGRRIMIVAGGSIIGDVYGLYWIWDRIRVHHALPDINVTRVPALKARVAAAWGRRGRGGSSREEMRNALRYSTNWVSGPNVLDLVPWASEPEATSNAETREATRGLIDYAHSLHMKYFAFSNDITLHPSILDEHGATLSPCDPKLWEAVQDKYRRLFEALPELDGVEICNDDISGFWDDYIAYDVMHDSPDCDWSYEKRFRTFVKAVHTVVAEEFNKTYFHMTWGLTAHEQHVQPAVFREIFTPEIPTHNLYLMPKVTAADRWWHQPYNSTFNQTPHDTVVLFETMNYYEGGGTPLFPTFSGEYFQNGLQTFLLPETSNVRGGATLAGVAANGWDTTSAHVYMLYRLMWDPYADIKTIARDFCSIHFGPDAAEAMAAIYLRSPHAYKYGLHIEPVSYGQFNSLIHLRVGTFPVEGYPSIDGGREHLEFLERIYLRCDPWREETLDDLHHGLEVARQMQQQFEGVRPKLAPTAAGDVAGRLKMTEALIRTNVGYVELIFAYFDYMQSADDATREALDSAIGSLAGAREAFVALPGFKYNLFGVDQLLLNARAAWEDVVAARDALERAPTRSELEATIAEQQRRYVDVLEAHRDESVHFAEFEGMIDGRDILIIQDDTARVEHIRWDGPEIVVNDVIVPLPREAVTVVPVDRYSRPLHPFVLEQPSIANDYTVRIYLDDLPGGKDWMKFSLYYIPRPPDELGL